MNKIEVGNYNYHTVSKFEHGIAIASEFYDCNEFGDKCSYRELFIKQNGEEIKPVAESTKIGTCLDTLIIFEVDNKYICKYRDRTITLHEFIEFVNSAFPVNTTYHRDCMRLVNKCINRSWV